MEENRRSLRVLASIPVNLTFGQGPPVPAVTAVVNRHGALVLSTLLHGEGTVLRIQNELTSEATECRVVWTGVDPSGTYKLGVEFIDSTPAFWGEVYETTWRQVGR